MTGEELYREWLGDPEGVTGAARYFPSMNPAEQKHWEDLAAKVGLQREALQSVRGGIAKWDSEAPSVASLLATLDRVLAL